MHADADASRLTVALPPVASKLTALGEIVKLHCTLVAPCETVTVCPATVSVPDRAAPPVFAATEYVTVPFPLPLAPDVTVMNEALLVAVHAQPEDAVTATVAVPPVFATDCVVGLTANAHVVPPTVSTTSFDAPLVPQAFRDFTRT